jgi:putative phosphoribosyl transferase
VEDVRAIVIFAHGSGSSRRSPRYRLVARRLNDVGIGTLLLDFLTPEEELNRANVFDIDLLTKRLGSATNWLSTHPETSSCAVGYFGASTAAAPALRAAQRSRHHVSAIVCRGGRVDLTELAFGELDVPTLLIVGGADTVARSRPSRVRVSSRSYPARVTCSKSQVPLKEWRTWRAAGSRST